MEHVSEKWSGAAEAPSALAQGGGACGGRATLSQTLVRLAEDEAALRAKGPSDSVASILERLVALRGLHEGSAESLQKLNAAVLEQQALDEKLKSNDAALARVAAAVARLTDRA